MVRLGLHLGRVGDIVAVAQRGNFASKVLDRKGSTSRRLPRMSDRAKTTNCHTNCTQWQSPGKFQASH